MIQLENLVYEIGNKTILDDVSLRIEPGSKVAIFGESGSGKTTLLKICIGQLTPQMGQIVIGGVELEPKYLPKIRQLAFYMPQEVRPIDEENTSEFVLAYFTFKMNCHLTPKRSKIERVFDALNLAPHLLDEPMHTLSGGERQRVGVARGLLLKRKLMLLDEITSAVDNKNRDRIVKEVLALTDTTVVAVTHDSRFIDRSDMCIEMKKGRVVRCD